MAIRGEAEMSGEQGHEDDGGGGVGRDVEVEIHDRVQQQGEQRDGPAEHEGRAVALPRAEVVTFPLDVFPHAEHAEEHEREGRCHERGAHHAVVGERVEVVVVRATGTGLDETIAVQPEERVEVARARAPPEICLPDFHRRRPDFEARVVELLRVERLVHPLGSRLHLGDDPYRRHGEEDEHDERG